MTTPQWSSRPIPNAAAPAATQPPTKQGSKAIAALAVAGALAVVGVGYLATADNAGDGQASSNTTISSGAAAGDGSGGDTTANGASAAVGSTSDDKADDNAPPEATTSLLPATTVTTEPPVTTSTEPPTTTTTQDAAVAPETAIVDNMMTVDELSKSESSDDSTDESRAEAHDPTRRAVFSGGTLYLQGSIPSADIGETIAAKAAQVPGVREVIIDYIIDPDVELAASAPLVVEDVVLFAYNSAELNPAYTPILDMGIALMNLNEKVVITVIGHTDSDGSTLSNLALAEARASMVAQYWLDRGIPASQIATDIRGESDPVGDESTPEGAAANRRVEFIITGLLQ